MTYIDTRKLKKTRVAEHGQTSAYSLPEGMTIKELLRLVRRVSPAIGLPTAAVDLLAMYYGSGQDQDWESGNSCKSWVQVKTASKWRNVDDKTIYNHNQALANQGIIAYSDYGNYRRFGFRSKNDGTIIDESTFGIDLKPVIERIEEFQLIALKLDEAEETHLHTHRRVSSLRSKIINAWPDELTMDESLSSMLNTCPRRRWRLERLQSLLSQLETHWDMLIDWYKNNENAQKNVQTAEDEENQQDVSDISRHIYTKQTITIL